MTNFLWFLIIVVAGLGGWNSGTRLGNVVVEWWMDTSPAYNKEI